MIAGTCGLLGGLIDVFFVGLPGTGKLSKYTDDSVDCFVQKFARSIGWKPGEDSTNIKSSAIGFLEGQKDVPRKINLDDGMNLNLPQQLLEKLGLISKKGNENYYFSGFMINYDQATSNGKNGTAGVIKNLSPKNHHIKSIGHSPDLIGMIFSILDQFTNKSHFVDGGRIISVDTENFDLKGSDFLSKIFAGFVNWLGHCISDMAGSKGTAAGERGSGIPLPFCSLLQFINVGGFGKDKQTFAKIAVQVFEQGYEFRHGMALAIPVFVTELFTRFMWVIKQRFYHEQQFSECIPSANNPELRRMLLIAHGSLCLVDTTDATVRSGGNMIKFMLRINLIAWTRFGTIALKELKVWYCVGDLDVEAVDGYLDAEYARLLASVNLITPEPGNENKFEPSDASSATGLTGIISC